LQFVQKRCVKLRIGNTWTAIKKLESENGARNVEICVNPDGKLFRFYENAWIEVGEEELLFHPEGGYWTCPPVTTPVSKSAKTRLVAISHGLLTTVLEALN